MSVVVERASFGELFASLQRRGYVTVGPTVRSQAITYDFLDGIEDLPIGWTDEQEAGTYRLVRRGDKALFGYVVGPHSLKKYLFPPRLTLFEVERTQDGVRIVDAPAAVPKYAFLGVRPCELAAMEVQDKVFRDGPFGDSAYVQRREPALVIVVNCAVTGGTCFCASMGTGPQATGGFDLAVTELIGDEFHRFLFDTGSPAGEDLMADIPHRPATAEDLDLAQRVLEAAAGKMGRSIDTRGIRDLLLANLEHPRWERVGDQCLTCANCTLVCPTCFCFTIEDTQALDGSAAGRIRHWASCFAVEFSYIHGGSLRTSPASRYRQWMTHKLATWIDQFGSSGCVGCGRCITWCPVGIDITQVAAVMRSSEESRHANA